jgi:hypothetical protein
VTPARLILLVIAAVVVALPAVAVAKPVHFTTPSGNIDCIGGFDNPGASVDCLVQKHSWPKVPKRPANCDLDWVGSEIQLTNGVVTLGSCRGDIGPLCLPGGADRCTVLAYGKSVLIKRAIRCTSRRTGLTCRARKGLGAGFKVSREGYRIFR